MLDRNADIADDKRITFRIGVNLGDVIAEGAIFTATASMSPLGWRRSRNPAGSASPARYGTTSATSSLTASKTKASKTSRTSLGRCASMR
jgi:hypothetical protein